MPNEHSAVWCKLCRPMHLVVVRIRLWHHITIPFLMVLSHVVAESEDDFCVESLFSPVVGGTMWSSAVLHKVRWAMLQRTSL